MPPSLIVLGAAQDAGLPQTGCGCENCSSVWAGDAPPQHAVSAALVGGNGVDVWLLDAGPDIKHQYHLLQQLVPGVQLRGVLLTHCHMGHYIGLAQLGKEGLNAQGLEVAGSASVCAFLRGNQPWATGVRDGNFVLRELRPHVAVQLFPGLSVAPVPVPHRAEFSDCVAYRCQGPSRSALWLPDIDSWEAWDEWQQGASGGSSEDGSGGGGPGGAEQRAAAGTSGPRGRYWAVRDAVGGVDTAFLDACFWDAGELPPGRDPATIPHPLVVDTLAALAGLEARVVLIHLNHTNPLWRPGSQQAGMALVAGFSLGKEGSVYAL